MNNRRLSRRLTIYDLADVVGTSPTAVSAVLNGTWRKRRISEALADRIRSAADAQGYAINLPASALRRETSRIIGMIVPKYDNRYFGAIAERFESMARERDLFPIITCTLRDPKLEEEAARAMISHQVTCIVATGATNPDRIADLCAPAGVRTINLDLPGHKAPSVISDNYTGARNLTACILKRIEKRRDDGASLLFIGGRAHDHNTLERLRGFHAAHAEVGMAVSGDHVLPCGYAAEKAEKALDAFVAAGNLLPAGLFVNSTITFEGVVSWLRARKWSRSTAPSIGCFDYDAFAACIEGTVGMVRQDVPKLVDAVFRLFDEEIREDARWIEVPPILIESGLRKRGRSSSPSDWGTRLC
ncbi:substrate-binding domain-containing protein (plasmid) [Lichenicola cladoniae]|uniref:Substrate-binding domain-containing protein n=1 Tax=Lichenicola cladoniae TaxID=1484109 RepID=A0A6M8HZ74_9PROT|nr:substrate-binding domain-containing protein [Lichenicola cladoniae]NPD67642.1 substrate-binding domain-containing protein [Acetobacteraceae bacterium]QKE93648.1 substrate-binding domain-containing protein [Lichenicola cladoniae]